VRFAGEYPIFEGMTVIGLIESAGGYLPEVDMKYALLARKDISTGVTSVQNLKLTSVKDLAVVINPQDQLLVFNLNESRKELLDPVIGNLKRSSNKQLMPQYVVIQGEVRFPGEYPLYEGMTLNELVGAAGGLLESAYTASVDVSRINVGKTNQFVMENKTLSLDSQDDQTRFLLKSRDHVVVKRITDWGREVKVSLAGELKFPGVYPVSAGETLGEVISRAGGLAASADLKGAIFLRESLKEKEQVVIDRFSRQMEKDLARLGKEGVSAGDDISAAKAAGASLLSELKGTEATGRLVIDLEAIIAGDKYEDIVLQQGDRLLIPVVQQEVSILGEVQFPTSHLYDRKLNGLDYVNKSGGFSRNADGKRTYVIKRDGQVRPLKKRWLYVFSRVDKVQPGDTIVVPMDVDTVSPIIYWGRVSQILFQLASTGAALKTFGAL